MRPLKSSFIRKPRKRVVSRSFRCSPEIDRALDEMAAKKQWTKTFLIRDIIVSYLTYHKAKGFHDDAKG